MLIQVNSTKCRPGHSGLPPCMKSCPEEAITLIDGVAVIDKSRCDYDGICIPACPFGAIEFVEKKE